MRLPRKRLALAPLLLLASAAIAQTILAPTPPMGWNSWNHFYQHVTDADVRAAADAMVANGMRDAGYVYVNIDDGWQGTRRPDGTIQGNERFPDMKALADYVHARGLKLGIYSSPGPKTCAKFEGSYGHEAQDAQTYAAWGVDYLKYDLCSFGDMLTKAGDGDQAAPAAFALQREAYRKMHDALVATGRPIVFSLCQYGMSNVWEWGPGVGGNLWRTTGDINDTYGRMALIGFSQAGLSRYAGPGHWNDPDMLEVGNGGMTLDEYRTHMSLWAILAAPLLAGNDLSHMKPEHLAILENKDVIAIDQDILGKQGDRVSALGPWEIWTKPMAHNRIAIALFNRGELAHTMPVNLRQLGVPPTAHIRNVWAGDDLPYSETINPIVPKHGVVLLLVSLAAAQQSTLPLWPTPAPLSLSAADQPSLDVYLPAANPTATGVLVIPGGSYHYLAAPEGQPVALWLQAHGIAAFVLHYRVAPNHYPAEMLDGLRAIRLVRSNAAQFGIDPNKLGVWGFSAGGHLASFLLTRYQPPLSPTPDTIDTIDARPSFGILAYPVIFMRPGFLHQGSHDNLLGPAATPALETQLSTDLHVTSDTPPTFLFATTDDGVVPVQNSLAFYQACIDHHVSVEMHLFEHGSHGLVLAQNRPGPSAWPDLLATWLTRHAWMQPQP